MVIPGDITLKETKVAMKSTFWRYFLGTIGKIYCYASLPKGSLEWEIFGISRFLLHRWIFSSFQLFSNFDSRRFTPPKTNMEPENGPLSNRRFLLETHHF